MPDDKLRAFRNEIYTLVRALESEILEASRKSKSSEDFVVNLIENCPGRLGDRVFQHLVTYYKDFWKFIQSDRYSGNIATIADAMAGVPKLTPRSSLNRCSTLGPPEIDANPFKVDSSRSPRFETD
jgi:hypothetical protein